MWAVAKAIVGRGNASLRSIRSLAESGERLPSSFLPNGLSLHPGGSVVSRPGLEPGMLMWQPLSLTNMLRSLPTLHFEVNIYLFNIFTPISTIHCTVFKRLATGRS